MKRVGQLFESVVDFHALSAAARRAARGKRLSAEAGRFLLDLETEVLRLERDLREGTYRPQPYRTFPIVDPKPRTISAAAFRDRVVHHALSAALEPVLERYAVDDSYACRRGKGGLAAIRRVQTFTRKFPRFLKLDVRRFFETCDHAALKALLLRLLKDRRVLELCDRFIDAGAPGSPPGTGLPIGNLTSQHFANLYLGPLDHFIKEDLRIPGYVRYMDDMVLFDATAGRLRSALHGVRIFLAERARLALRDERTLLAPVRDGVPFLGFRVWPRLVRLDGRRARRFRRLVRTRARALRADSIDEAACGRSLGSLCAWAAQGDTLRLRRALFLRMENDGILDS